MCAGRPGGVKIEFQLVLSQGSASPALLRSLSVISLDFSLGCSGLGREYAQ